MNAELIVSNPVFDTEIIKDNLPSVQTQKKKKSNSTGIDVRVNQDGSKTFYILYRHNGKLIREKVGKSTEGITIAYCKQFRGTYNFKIKAKDLTDSHAFVHGELVIAHGDVIRSAEAMGVCERSELRGNGGLHFMNARAETRALKRAIETIFSSVINYYVIHHLEAV